MTETELKQCIKFEKWIIYKLKCVRCGDEYNLTTCEEKSKYLEMKPPLDTKPPPSIGLPLTHTDCKWCQGQLTIEYIRNILDRIPKKDRIYPIKEEVQYITGICKNVGHHNFIDELDSCMWCGQPKDVEEEVEKE